LGTNPISYGASKDDALEKLKYDLYYIKTYLHYLDVIIIFETVKVVLFGKEQGKKVCCVYWVC